MDAMTWYDTPKNLRVPIDDAREVPPGNEYYIRLQAEDFEVEAFVPKDAVGPNGSDQRRVVAAAIGAVGKKVVVTLPSSSMGTVIFSVSEAFVRKHSA